MTLFLKIAHMKNLNLSENDMCMDIFPFFPLTHCWNYTFFKAIKSPCHKYVQPCYLRVDTNHIVIYFFQNIQWDLLQMFAQWQDNTADLKKFSYLDIFTWHLRYGNSTYFAPVLLHPKSQYRKGRTPPWDSPHWPHPSLYTEITSELSK